MIKDKKKSNELIYMLKAACYLSMDFKRQFEQMEWFARWDMPEEIGMEWIDAEGIIYSNELSQDISDDSLQLLVKILDNFKYAFDSPIESDVWSIESMQNHPFWIEQRSLAKRFLKSVQRE